jgi:hypothetical protein
MEQQADVEGWIARIDGESDPHRKLTAFAQWTCALVSSLARAGALQPGVSQREAVDRAWMLTGLELYLAAIDGCRWSDKALRGLAGGNARPTAPEIAGQTEACIGERGSRGARRR